MCLSYYRHFPPTLPDYKSGALPIELKRLRSKNKTMTYQVNTTRVEHLAILPGYGSNGILPRLDSEDFLLTQHLITPIPHPGRDNRFVKPFGFHAIMHDTASIGLVVEDILDGHS